MDTRQKRLEQRRPMHERLLLHLSQRIRVRVRAILVFSYKSTSARLTHAAAASARVGTPLTVLLVSRSHLSSFVRG